MSSRKKGPTKGQRNMVERVRSAGYIMYDIQDDAYYLPNGRKANKRLVRNCIQDGLLVEQGDAMQGFHSQTVRVAT